MMIIKVNGRETSAKKVSKEEKGYNVILTGDYFNGIHTFVEFADVIIDDIKASAKIEFDGHSEDMEAGGYITVTANSDKEAKTILEMIQNKLDVDWLNCPEVDEGKAMDSFGIEWEYGNMTETKKYIMTQFKQVKKELGLK